MRGEIKELLTFFELIGKVEYADNISEEIEAEYSINLIPDQDTLPLFNLNILQKLVDPNKVSIWFYYNRDRERNECRIKIAMFRKTPVGGRQT